MVHERKKKVKGSVKSEVKGVLLDHGHRDAGVWFLMNLDMDADLHSTD